MTPIASPVHHRSIVWVFSLVGTVAGLLLPIVDTGTRQSSLERATDMISSCVLLSRQKAVAGETKYRIEYGLRAFRIYREEAGGRWLLDTPKNRFQLPKDVEITPSSTPLGGIVIDSAGDIDGAGSPIWLQLQDGRGNRSSIRISKAGHVQELPDR